MSILIKGMTMPDMCSECDFLGGLIFPDGIYVCDCPVESIHGRNITRAVEEDARHPECPLVEVPEPHGALIDRDILEQELRNGIKAGNLEEGYENYANINSMDDCVECVRYADTVITAEGE